MATRGQTGRQWWAACIWKILLGAFIVGIEGTLLAAHAANIRTKTRGILTDYHSRHASIARAEERGFSSEWIFVTVVRGLKMGDRAGRSSAGTLSEAPAGDTGIIRGCVGRIPQRRHSSAPFFVRGKWLRHVMEILSFRIDNFPESACVVDLPHGGKIFVIAGRFEHHVFQPAALDRLEQPIGIFQ